MSLINTGAITKLTEPTNDIVNINNSLDLPRFGKHKQTTTIYPVNEINYSLDGCPVLWLNVNSIEEAITYYALNCPFLPDKLCAQIAIYDFYRKKQWFENNNNNKIV